MSLKKWISAAILGFVLALLSVRVGADEGGWSWFYTMTCLFLQPDGNNAKVSAIFHEGEDIRFLPRRLEHERPVIFLDVRGNIWNTYQSLYKKELAGESIEEVYETTCLLTPDLAEASTTASASVVIHFDYPEYVNPINPFMRDPIPFDVHISKNGRWAVPVRSKRAEPSRVVKEVIIKTPQRRWFLIPQKVDVETATVQWALKERCTSDRCVDEEMVARWACAGSVSVEFRFEDGGRQSRKMTAEEQYELSALYEIYSGLKFLKNFSSRTEDWRWGALWIKDPQTGQPKRMCSETDLNRRTYKDTHRVDRFEE